MTDLGKGMQKMNEINLVVSLAIVLSMALFVMINRAVPFELVEQIRLLLDI